MASAAADTRLGVQDTMRSAAELTEMANGLRQLVGRFRL